MLLKRTMNHALTTAGVVAAAGFGRHFFRKYVAGGVNRYHPDLTGKLAIVTGGNTGIGYETAKSLAKLNATVIVTVRNDTKGIHAVENLRRDTQSDRLDYVVLELSSFNSIRNFVKELEKRGQKIDILINNAGVFAPPYALTEEGFELQFGVNYMGHFLLTNLLLRDNLLADGSRIISLSSHGHYSGKINFDDLNWTKKYSGFAAYAQSKLANILFTRELNRRLKEQNKNITAVSCHPGMVVTEMGRHMAWYVTLVLSSVMQWFTKTAEQGAQTTLYCALAPEVAQQGGEYFSDCKVYKPSVAARDNELAKRLWEVSEQLASLSNTAL